MDQTAGRIRKIREIVRRGSVPTQEDLVRALRRDGIEVTQATISRDVKRLGLVKVLDGSGRYRYALPEAASSDSRPLSTAQRLQSVFDEFVIDVVAALGLILVKTQPGGAPPARRRSTTCAGPTWRARSPVRTQSSSFPRPAGSARRC